MALPTLNVGKETFTLAEVGHLVRAFRDGAAAPLYARLLKALKQEAVDALLGDLDPAATQKARGAYQAIEGLETSLGVNLSVWYDTVMEQIQKTNQNQE